MSKDTIVKTSNIKIAVGLDKANVPISMEWNADDNAESKPMEAKAFLLSIFDKESKDTLKIDLWTNDMQVVEMDRFFYQSLRAMADTYYKATQNRELAVDMQKFVQYFGERLRLLRKAS